ncbi:265_t:CDS:2 [Gigaspora margarita]|uniref:265_t:CDS:1 n=1 Tax=Gigaspora margarita TaxID=4874 RepID=A0ABN7UFI6_GIGMA|nr:265_t:CDS:2 [Gigaspora margarita]
MSRNKRKTSLRTALMLAPQLQQYIYNIDKILDTGVLVDLFLLHNTKVQQARRKNMLVIMIGDFNDNITRKKNKNQTPLLGNLLKNNVLNKVIYKFVKPELWEADGVTDSDHVILNTSWKINLRAKLKRKKKTIRKCYQYDKTSKED